MGRANHSQDQTQPPAGFPAATEGTSRGPGAPPDKGTAVGELERAEQALDRAIGRRIRAARLARRMTQEQLAQVLGCSYQQIQKYENGSNRIAAARLVLLARRLELSPAALLGLAEPADEQPEPRSAAGAATERAARELARGFGEIRDAEVRSALASLIRTVAERQA
jgi:transcriptional regulator with XRE-family HTH domain